MELVFRPLEKAQAHEIMGWHYEPPYDVYNMGRGDTTAAIQDLLRPEYAYHAILTQADELVAFCCFGKDAQVPGGTYEADALDIGLGVRPNLTGQGQGQAYVQAVLDFARRMYAPRVYRVTIAAFNTRARRVWTRAGFQLVQRFESTHSRQPFVICVYGM